MPVNVRTAGRRAALVAALVMVVGLGVVSAASAATKMPVWSTNGSTPLTFGTEVSFSGSSVHGMNLKWVSGGVHFWIECNTLSASGKVENYASGKAGTMTPGTAKFEGCRVAEVGVWDTTCTVPNEIPFKYGSGELTNTPYTTGGLKLSNVSIALTLSGCPQNAYKNLQWEFWGNITGAEGFGSWPGEIRFSEGTPLSMNAGGTGAVIETGMNIQQGGSTPIKVIEEEIVVPSTPGHRYWYTGGGMRKGEGARTLVPAGSPLALKGSGDSLTIEGFNYGIPVTVSCNAGSTEGSVENPAGGADGVIGTTVKYTGCTVVKPENLSCAVEGGAITTKALSGTWYTAKPPPYLRLTGPSEQVTEFKLTGCTKKPTYLNVAYQLVGKLSVTENGVSTWSIPKSLNEGTLTMSGNYATAYGTLVAESSKGELVSWAE